MRKEKGGIIFYLIFIIATILIVALIFFTDAWKEKNTDNIDKRQEQVDLVKLGEEYKNKIKDILPTYEEVIANMNKEKIEELRGQLLELKMPEEFKEAHVELVLLLDKVEQNISSKEVQKKLNEIINKYDWLKEVE